MKAKRFDMQICNDMIAAVIANKGSITQALTIDQVRSKYFDKYEPLEEKDIEGYSIESAANTNWDSPYGITLGATDCILAGSSNSKQIFINKNIPTISFMTDDEGKILDFSIGRGVNAGTAEDTYYAVPHMPKFANILFYYSGAAASTLAGVRRKYARPGRGIFAAKMIAGLTSSAMALEGSSSYAEYDYAWMDYDNTFLSYDLPVGGINSRFMLATGSASNNTRMYMFMGEDPTNWVGSPRVGAYPFPADADPNVDPATITESWDNSTIVPLRIMLAPTAVVTQSTGTAGKTMALYTYSLFKETNASDELITFSSMLNLGGDNLSIDDVVAAISGLFCAV